MLRRAVFLCLAWGAVCLAISPGELSRAIAERRHRVAELEILTEAAKALGLRLWLFGGTAAGFGHYVKWDLMRKAGDTRYQPSRFDYDFTSIYRSTQDADLVIDGTPADAEKLEALVKGRLSFLQGSKQQWEVRLLRHDRGDKIALLNNPDFLKQHTDSNSTGMIELTASEEPVVRDLREWENKSDPPFLRDLAEGKLHYYFSPDHETTRFFREGRNPEIFSVIRYFTKAFQYELEMREDEVATLEKLVRDFDPARDLASPYAKNWLEKNGKKLIAHAANLEYAFATLDRIGLRQKLIDVRNDPKTPDSLAWWLSKEPLRSHPVGQGPGRTARALAAELGIPWDELVVSHETSHFLAYESITRDTTGRPNVLISRNGFPGEAAMYGDGHYTRIGRAGARGTGLTIRYRVDPNAREGSDFTVHGDYIVWKNRAALTVIPESIQLGALEYFKMILGGKSIDPADKGLFEKLKRRIRRTALLPDGELKEITWLLKEALTPVGPREPKGIETRRLILLQELIEFFGEDLPRDKVLQALSLERDEIDLALFRNWFSRPKNFADEALSDVWVEFLGGAAFWYQAAVLREFLATDAAKAHPRRFDLLRALSRTETASVRADLLALSESVSWWHEEPGTSEMLKFVKLADDIEHVRIKPEDLDALPGAENLVKRLFELSWDEENEGRRRLPLFLAGLLSRPRWASHPLAESWMEMLVEGKRRPRDGWVGTAQGLWGGYRTVPQTLFLTALSTERWQNHPRFYDWVKKLLHDEQVVDYRYRYFWELVQLLSHPRFVNDERAVAIVCDLALFQRDSRPKIRELFFSPGPWQKSPLLPRILDAVNEDALVLNAIHDSEGWADSTIGPHLVRQAISYLARGENRQHWMFSQVKSNLFWLLRHEEWARSPLATGIMESLLKNEKLRFKIEELLRTPAWASHPRAAEWLRRLGFSCETMIAGLTPPQAD